MASSSNDNDSSHSSLAADEDGNETVKQDVIEDVEQQPNAEVTEKENQLGCQHYKRKCQLVAPCCGRSYTCRFCHDDNETHQLIRTSVMEVVCLVCQLKQSVSNLCISCSTVFGNYFCHICRLYDDEDKKQFHCDGCGICRIGGRDRFFHCDKCGLCLEIKRQNNHKCIENASRSNCPVCLEDIHSSRVSAHAPPCGHLIHRTCYEDLLKYGNYTCPLCNLSMVNMRPVWHHLDEELASTPMPTEYAGLQVGVLCRDCHRESQVTFHVVGLKCAHCGSYNTCRTSGMVQPEQGRRGSRRQLLHTTLLDLMRQLRGSMDSSVDSDMRTC